MESSSQLTKILKSAAVAGIFINIVIAGVMFVAILISDNTTLAMWIALWGSFGVSFPAFGILYGTLKCRELLRDIRSNTSN